MFAYVLGWSECKAKEGSLQQAWERWRVWELKVSKLIGFVERIGDESLSKKVTEFGVELMRSWSKFSINPSGNIRMACDVRLV